MGSAVPGGGRGRLRILRGPRASDSRALRWAGPPPLLIAATVVGMVVAPMVSSADEGRPADRRDAQIQLSSAERLPTTVDPKAGPTIPRVKQSTVAVKRDVVGVVTMNQFRQLRPAEARADALALAARPGVDIIGWQEAYRTGGALSSLNDDRWASKRFPGTKELAISWRRSAFSLESSQTRLLVRGVGPWQGRDPFDDRYAVRLTLRHRASGQLLSVINTHLPQGAEDLARPGTWRPTRNATRARMQLAGLTDVWDDAPGRWVVGTGDYNFDAIADSRVRAAGGPARTLAGTVVSSYAALGFAGLEPTHPASGRYIDYVQVARADLNRGRARFLGQRTVSGLRSDHRPLLAWVALR